MGGSGIAGGAAGDVSSGGSVGGSGPSGSAGRGNNGNGNGPGNNNGLGNGSEPADNSDTDVKGIDPSNPGGGNGKAGTVAMVAGAAAMVMAEVMEALDDKP
jgi:hypothetical protein